jgi:DNA-binding beta-propeller fold protein YncE/cytochrome c553
MKYEQTLVGSLGLAAAVAGVGGCLAMRDRPSSSRASIPSPTMEPEFDGGASCSFDGGCDLTGTVPLFNVFQPTFRATVTTPDVPPPPISGGTLIALQDGATAVAADPDRDAVYVIDLAASTVTYTLALQIGDEPGRLVEDGAGRVHVALRGGGALVTIDPSTGTVLARRNVCPAPRGLAWDKATDFVWVACATGELAAFPAAGGTAARSLVVERDLRDVIVEADGSLAVSSFRSAQMLHLATDGTIVRRDVVSSFPPFSPQVAWRSVAGPGGGICAVHQGHSNASLPTNAPGGYGALSPESGAVTGMLTELDPDGRIVASFSLPAVLPVDMAVSPDGSAAVVVAAGNGLVAELPDVFLVALDGSATADGVFLPEEPFLNGGPFALDGGPSLPRSGGTVDDSLLGQPGAKLPAPLGTEATAVAFDAAGEILVLTREPATLWVLDSSRTSWRPIALSTVSRDDTGHDIFHSSAGALVACASCHPEGGDDGHVWTLDGNARRTPSLRGTVAGTAPYHWPGDEPDFVALTEDVYTGRMSGQKLDTGPMKALSDWVQNIPAPPAPSWVDGAAAARGQVLFRSAVTGCSSCHSGAKLTNNATVDVSTGGLFQVPPLVGVGWRTPLMHSGCAATIADRFGACATLNHGTTAGLSAANVSDLTAYLESL